MNRMKYINKILFFIFIFVISLSNVMAIDNNLVNIYFFHSDSCAHCNKELKLLDKLENEYDNIKIYKYEISNIDNSLLLNKVAELMNDRVTGVPYTVIGSTAYKGYSEDESIGKFKATVDYYSEYGYKDIVGEYIGNIELPTYELKDDVIDVNDYVRDKTSYKVTLPLIGTVELKNLTLPLITLIIGIVDGFNPCAMWILLFLISMLINMRDKKRMIILGTVFLLASSMVYTIFMFTWLNLANVFMSIFWIRLIIALIALIGGIINIMGYFHKKEDGCDVVDDKKRNKIFTRIKRFTSENKLSIAIIGIIFLAVSVNIVELACSAGLPLMYTEILSLNNLTKLEEIFYILLYMLFFMLDDLIVFIIAVVTSSLTGFSSKYGKISKLVGGIILLLIGILLIFKPAWLMFNF